MGPLFTVKHRLKVKFPSGPNIPWGREKCNIKTHFAWDRNEGFSPVCSVNDIEVRGFGPGTVEVAESEIYDLRYIDLGSALAEGLQARFAELNFNL